MRQLAPLIMANLPGDHDTFMLYQPEVGHLLTRHLLEPAGLRQEACRAGVAGAGPAAARAGRRPTTLVWSHVPPAAHCRWLPCVCTEPRDLPRLLALLQHRDGWVRINAAKAMAWLGDRRAIEPLAQLLRQTAKAEADFGYSGTFKDEEYNDPGAALARGAGAGAGTCCRPTSTPTC